VIEGQGEVEELQKDLQEQGLKADDVSTVSHVNTAYYYCLLVLYTVY